MKPTTRNEVVELRRKNLRQWIRDHYKNQAEFVSRHELNQGEISALMRDKAFGEVKARNLEQICNMPHMYLDGADEPKFSRLRSVPKNNDSNVIYITQHNDIAGSMGGGLILSDQPGQIREWVVTMEWAEKNIPTNTGNQNLRIVTGFGDSMKGMFKSGDPLLIDSGVKEVKFDGVYFFRIGEEGFIKRLQRIPGQGIRAISENSAYEAWTITPDMDFHVLGRVLKVWEGSEF